jgi:transposase
VLIDHTNDRVLEVLESRDKQAVVAWLTQAKESGLLADLEEVTTDMWDGYVEAVKEVFGPQVRITIDRFHVMQNFQAALNQARRQIQRQLPKEAAAELKGTRWLWVTNPENLESEQLQEMERLKERFPILAALSAQRQSLRAIFEDRTIRSAQQGMEKLRQWRDRALALGLAGLETFCNTLANWMDKIANYFVSRSSNGQTEGFNHGIRAILWRGFGLPNFAHLRLRVLHAFG